ncbi:PREDICTED: probable methyltransferase BTM2 homolog [Ceratosolen solmsi marchali]|uniref:Probable methyltransferase BTM2 homolog n=1 Tax=Ceratosolen solmsi marchali TaxID=326594 RepID=A0AAJ6YT55_9HYME|nr:PREDICTED: probable methyltransferase BTM2 homolog [Ceratosolen solmsi marchali]XP_011503706.1 PREDICTED: probable methyltransferase BTM2 homolog [Ceratosolen solmsi marchali]
MEGKCDKYIEFNKKNYKRISEKQKQLANFIKKLHAELRSEYEILGIDEAWKIHVTKSEQLKTYAEFMYELANKYWTYESKNTSVTYCRIEWIKQQCKDYFFNGKMNEFDAREEYLFKKNIQILNKNFNIKNIKTTVSSTISVLDVGSCYNPFKTENKFSVTAIDIVPYSNDVIKCDFLNLKNIFHVQNNDIYVAKKYIIY